MKGYHFGKPIIRLQAIARLKSLRITVEFSLFIVSIITFFSLSSVPVDAQGPVENVVYTEDFSNPVNPGWQLDDGWFIKDALYADNSNNIPVRARYIGGVLGDNESRNSYKFDLVSFNGNVRFNFNLTDSTCYSLDLDNSSGTFIIITLSLLRSTNGFITYTSELIGNTQIEYTAMRYTIRTVTEPGGLQVYIYDARINPDSIAPLMDYPQVDLLPAGSVMFEAQQYTFVQIDDIVVTSTALPPFGPTELRVSFLSPGSVELIWKDNSQNENGFRIERASNESFNSNLLIRTSDANVTGFGDNSVSPGNGYFYRVYAFNQSGQSPPSNVLQVLVPNVPFTPTLTPTNSFPPLPTTNSPATTFPTFPSLPVSPPVENQRPDLVIISVNYWFENDNQTLVLDVDIENPGTARADATSLLINDETSGTMLNLSDVPSMASGELTTLSIYLDVFGDEFHSSHELSLRVDPQDLIPELDEANNEISVDVQLPFQPAFFPWIIIGFVLIAGSVSGIFLRRWLNLRKLSARINNNFKDEVYSIEADKANLTDCEIRIRAITDSGSQEIEFEAPIISGEKEGN